MAIGKFALQYGPILAAIGILLIFVRSQPRQRIALALAWAFPGVGHLWLGERKRGLIFAAGILPVFIVGLALSEFASVSPFDRHPLWGLAQIPGGLMTAFTWLATLGVRIDSYDGIYQVGSLYVGSACLLNVLAMCDAWDIAGGHLDAAKEEPDSTTSETPGAGEAESA